jgi:hypothetical protein
MAEPRPSTGIADLDSDLAELFDLVDDEPRLAEAKEAIADPKTSLESLREHMPAGVMRLASFLIDLEAQSKALADIEDAKTREALTKASELVRMHLSGLANRPTIVAEMRRELTQELKGRNDADNAIAGIQSEPIWTEERDALEPSVLLRFRGAGGELLLASKLDWDDLTFLIGALSRVLQSHMTKSEPLVEAGLLSVPDARSIAERLDSAVEALAGVRELGKKFGIEMKDFPDNFTDHGPTE